MAICVNCRQEIGDAPAVTNQWGAYHLDERRCLVAALERAKRAEADAADAANDLEIVATKLRRAEAAYEEWRATAARYLAGMREVMERNAALRAELAEAKAAREWRPVTEPPTEDGDYLVWSPLVDQYIAAWYDGAFHSRYIKQPTHWQSLPAAPDAGQE